MEIEYSDDLLRVDENLAGVDWDKLDGLVSQGEHSPLKGLEGIDPDEVREVLRRMDILSIARGLGFVSSGPPDDNGWIPGRFPGFGGLLNIGFGPERGFFKECDLTHVVLIPPCNLN